MILLPFTAANLMLRRPKLLALGFFPGAFTFLLASIAVYGLWVWQLTTVTLWLSLPMMMLAFLLAWLLIGKIALLPVEDAIIDECQRQRLGEIRWPAPPLSLARVGRELVFSLLLAIVGFALFFSSFVPFLTPINLLLAAWLTAYGFLSPIYARLAPDFSGRRELFFRRPVAHAFLGLVLTALLFVPVLNVFLLGYAQVLAAVTAFDEKTTAFPRT